MDMKTLRKNAREKLKPFCRVCPVCDGVACAGEVPGMGGVGTGESFKENVKALARVKLNMRTLHDAKAPDISCEIFGKQLSMPILAAPITGSEYNMGGKVSEEDYAKAAISGSVAAGTLGMTGDGGNPLFYDAGIDAIKAEKGMGIPVIKPRENSIIVEMAAKAKQAGAPAVGMDIDGAGLVTMALMGQPVGPKTPSELRNIIEEVKMPFILKGIMTPEEAEIACEAGAAAIVVSNHGGRVLDSTPGVAQVLPEIAKRVKGKVTIFADGGVRKGIDVLKYMALGADAVLVGRPIITGAFGGGADGVKLILETLANELKQAMILTGCEDLSQITPDVLYNPNS
jgi:4-hydroxymandelate oxidase